MYTLVRASAVPNYLKVRLPVPSQLKITNWRTALKLYGDQSLTDFLAFGWPIDYTKDTPPVPTLVNHAKSNEDQQHIQDFVEKELELGALLGPFNSLPFKPWTQISPLMVKPKKDTDSKRIVIDLSFPLKKGVNAGIKKGCFQGTKIDFSLPSVSHIAEKMIELGKGAYMWTIDLARAYRQLRICPLALPLLGLQSKNSYYIDICPSFGCRSSAYACARTTAAIVWLLKQQGIITFCYLDDFVGIATTLGQATKDYNTALSLLTYLFFFSTRFYSVFSASTGLPAAYKWLWYMRLYRYHIEMREQK